MELPLLYIIILLFNMLDFSSGMIYNKGTLEKRLSCINYGHTAKNGTIKLFLFLENLVIQCYFQSDNTLTSEEFLSTFASGGISPSLEIINSTYTGIFHFNLTLFSAQAYWLIEIPRENITKNT
ncbi:cation channel sperm-associated auxiliary subunit beta-like, partial [Talpa occidentalis]